MGIYKIYKRLPPDSRAQIRSVLRAILPAPLYRRVGAIGEPARRMVETTSIVQAAAFEKKKYEVAGAAAVAPGHFDDAYFAVRNPLIQRAVERCAQGVSPAEAVADVTAGPFDERMIAYPCAAAWLRAQGRLETLLDLSGHFAHKTLATTLRAHCDRLAVANFADDGAFVSRCPAFYAMADTYQRWPKRFRFQAAAAIWMPKHAKYNKKLCGATIPEKCITTIPTPLPDAAAKMANCMLPGGSLLLGVAHSLCNDAELDAVAPAFTDAGVEVTREVFSRRNGGWVAASDAGDDSSMSFFTGRLAAS